MALNNLTTAMSNYRRTSGPRCGIDMILDKLDRDDQKTLEDILEPDSGYPHTVIADALTADGYPVSVAQVGNHRRGRCRCWVTFQIINPATEKEAGK